MITIEDLQNLKYSWSAEIMQNNGLIFTIWYTCLPSIKHEIRKVISVSSDYPKHTIDKK